MGSDLEKCKVKLTTNEWYYFRLRMVTTLESKDEIDVNTWKLAILNCLQQVKGVIGQSVEFDIMTSDELSGTETVVRVHYQDRIVFSECIAAGSFESHNNSGEAGIRIEGRSVTIQGLVVPLLNWA